MNDLAAAEKSDREADANRLKSIANKNKIKLKEKLVGTVETIYKKVYANNTDDKSTSAGPGKKYDTGLSKDIISAEVAAVTAKIVALVFGSTVVVTLSVRQVYSRSLLFLLSSGVEQVIF